MPQINARHAVAVPDGVGFVAHKRFRLRDPKARGEIRELDCWLGSREAWEASPFAGAFGWAVDSLPGGNVLAIRLD